MKKFIIDNKQKEDILKMHGFIKEQDPGLGPDGNTITATPPVQPTEPETETQTEKKVTIQVSGKDKLQRALDSKCIAKYTWFTPDRSRPLTKTKSGKDVIFGKGSNGNTYLFYDDMRVVNVDTKVTKNWTCEELNKPAQVKLDANQNKVLEIIGKKGWFATPVPTDVEVEDGTFIKQDLTTTKDPFLATYSKYFRVSFPQGYNVFRTAGSTPSVTPTGTPTTPSTTPVPPKTSQEVQLQGMDANQLSETGKSLMDEVRKGYSIQACTKLVDTYFEMAQDGSPSKSTGIFQDAIYQCNNNNRAKWREETKDKLRWLRGDEEDARKIFGLFKRFPKIGNIRDTSGRKTFRLNQLPQV
jgi:hypothetical protein